MTADSTIPADLIERERARFEAHYRACGRQEHWFFRHNGRYVSWIEREWQAWLARASQPVEVTEEMVANAASELRNPTVPTVFSRCIEEDGKRIYVVGYVNDDGSEVIRYRGNFGPLAESDHFDLENEVLARAVLTAALTGGA